MAPDESSVYQMHHGLRDLLVGTDRPLREPIVDRTSSMLWISTLTGNSEETVSFLYRNPQSCAPGLGSAKEHM
jgi:hypothetical protein